MDPIRDDNQLPPITTRRRLLHLQRIFFTFAIALSIIYGGGALSAALYHVLDNRAFDAATSGPAASPSGATPAADPGKPRTGPLARLEIPKIGLSVVVLDGTDAWTLNRAVGHIAGTSYPGAEGNIGIAGHRDGYFRELRHLRPSDEILLTSTNGSVERYRVDKTRIVAPGDVSVLAPGKTPSITLVTCYPFSYVGTAPQRYVLTASKIVAEPARREIPTS